MKKLVALVLLVAALAAGYLYYYAPRATMRSIQAAIEERDQAALTELIDFAALRRQLKAQLKDQFADVLPTAQENVIGKLVTGIASTFADKVLESMVTPEGLVNLLSGNTKAAMRGDRPPDSAAAELERAVEQADYAIASHDKVHVVIKGDDGSQVQLILSRGGLRWRMTGYVVPEDKAEDGAEGGGAAAPWPKRPVRQRSGSTQGSGSR